ncbi:MAG TPA: SWIB/MDM2 domain-containing protein [Bacteriovoracaceae bacterium]|nr:SWIB/MDM2 domain-containing protein [Bacteriovoracaceae bacterium]
MAKKTTAKKTTAKKATAKKAPAAKKATAKKAAPAKKATAKTAAPKKATAKKAAAPKKAKTARKPNAAFMKALKPSSALAEIIGAASVARTEAVKKIWGYIKKHNLQNPKNKRNILADDKLSKVFGKKEVTMFELASILGKHLS